VTEANHQQPRSRLTIEVVLNVEPDHFYRQAVEMVRAEDPELVPLLPPVPEGASAAEILDDWLSGEEPGDERARKAQDALLTALESSIVVAVIDHLGDSDAEVGIQLEEAWDDAAEDAPFAELPDDHDGTSPEQPDSAGQGRNWWEKDATQYRNDREQTNMAPDDLRSNEL
jgi:hypothetical protein